MPKTVTCVICGQEVSKRKSLAYSDGRACRDHEDVIKMVQEIKNSKAQKRLDEKIKSSSWEWTKILIVEQYRVYWSMYNQMTARVYLSSILHKLHKDERKEIRELVANAEPMTPDEITKSLMTYMHFHEKVSGTS